MDSGVVSFGKKNSVNVGDIVVLKSGSPLLTVRTIIPGKGDVQGMTTVDWFVEGENYNATFYENQLIQAKNKGIDQ